MMGDRGTGVDCRSSRRALLLGGVTLALVACATTPLPPAPASPAPTPAPAPTTRPPAVEPSPVVTPPPASSAQPLPGPPTTASRPPASAPSSVAAQPVAPARPDAIARYDRIAFTGLPAIADAEWVASWPAFLQSCTALASLPAWKAVCGRAGAVDGRSAQAIRGFFANGFDAYRVRTTAPNGRDDVRDTGLVTGYYEPLLKGSRKRSPKYPVPLYRVPDDLVTVDLAGVYPELAGLRVRGKLQGRKLVPYPSRAEINATNALRGYELLWVDDAIDAFFLHVQGSGRVQLDDGRTVRLGYGDSNGHPYKSIGRWLVDQGELTIDQASMQGIKAWAAMNPQRLNQLLEQNPSFVFFREVPLGDANAGPTGALNVPLTPGVSLAVDTRFIPLGAPVVLASTDPWTGAKFTRPMLAQDTGTAIRGPLRFDYFWGFGAAAGEKAGRQKHEGSAWLLTPRGVAPEALLKR